MKKEKVPTLIILCILITYTVGKDLFTSDDDMISHVPGGKGLPASNDASKFENRNPTDSKIDKFPATFIRTFVVRRAAKKHKMPSSSQEARKHSSAKGSNKGKDRFVFPSKISTLGTSKPFESFKTEMRPAALQLTTVSSKGKIIPSTPTPYTNSERILNRSGATKTDTEKSAHSGKDKFRPPDTVTGKQRPSGGTTAAPLAPTRPGGTTATPTPNILVTPRTQESEGLRLELPYDHARTGSDEDTKNERVIKKGKNCYSSAEEQPRSGPLATSLAGVLAGILILFLILTVVPRLRRIYNNRWRRRSNPKFGLNIPPNGYLSEELSEEEIIFDRAVLERKNNSSKTGNSKATSWTSPKWMKPDHYSTILSTGTQQEQKIWTLTEKPRSTPLMAVFENTKNPGTEIWTGNKNPDPKLTEAWLSTSSLSESDVSTPAETSRSASLTSVSVFSLTPEFEGRDDEFSLHESISRCSLNEITVSDPLPARPLSTTVPTASSILTIPETTTLPHPSSPQQFISLVLNAASSDKLAHTSSMELDRITSSTESCKPNAILSEPSPSPHPSATQPSSILSLRPASSDELTLTTSMAMDRKSCKIPVAPRNEVVIGINAEEDEGISCPNESNKEIIGKKSAAQVSITMENTVEEASKDMLCVSRVL
ncbi:flocculation protein FLO11-like [Stylophora pistillata]|uniref:flocculation protein FLO11-like n=1 Tax=Stylophora pistillata TaxID=50429 RepID=UPI000C03FFC2|nr:flocculation protein FLO11-like [Stylophora pistillata]